MRRRRTVDHRRAEQGLTLIELMVVIVIVGVLGAIVAANMARTDNAGAAKGLAFKIWVAMRSARTSAANIGAVVRMRFTDQPTTNSTLIQVSRNANVGPNPTGVWLTMETFESPKGGRVLGITDTADAAANNSASGSLPRTILFNPDGTAGVDGGPLAGATVYVQDISNKYQYKVYVYRLTGFSRLVSGW